VSTISQPARHAARRQPGLLDTDLGTLYVFAVPMLAVIGIMRGESFSVVGDYNYTGFLWLGALFSGILLFAATMAMRLRRVYFPYVPWVVWLAFVWMSFAWSDQPGHDQLREAVQLGMPLWTAMLASLFVQSREQLARLFRCFYWTVPLMIVAVLLFFAGFDYDLRTDVFVEVRSLATTAVIVGAAFITAVDRKYLRWIGWSACLVLTVVTGGRIGTAALLTLPILSPVGGTLTRKLLVAACIVLVGVGMLATPIFQERFFWGEGGGVGDIVKGEFDSRGRFDVWPILFEESLRRPLLGHGVGSCQQIVPLIWQPSIAFPHNDYLRFLYEYGMIGLVLFLVVIFWQMTSVLREMRRATGIVRQAFATAWLGLAVFLLIACTDNPVTYILFFMDPLFALMGAAYGVARAEEARRAPARHVAFPPALAIRLG
jgi:O-antigen ligase